MFSYHRMFMFFDALMEIQVASVPKQICMAQTTCEFICYTLLVYHRSFSSVTLGWSKFPRAFSLKMSWSNATWWFDQWVMGNLVTRFVKLDCVTLLTMLLCVLFPDRNQEDEQNTLTETEEVSLLLDCNNTLLIAFLINHN